MTPISNYSPSSSCASKIDIENLSSKDAVIFVVGTAGSGKDNFLRLATGLELVEDTRHDLHSSEHKFSAIRVSWPELSESDICFLDTPAFDRRMSGEEIANTISEWSDEIRYTIGKDFKLEGLLYFHRISDTHTARTSVNDPRCFERLIAANRIILATTMWDEVDEETGRRHEQQIRTDWKALLDSGSSLKRFRYVRASIFEIIAPIIGAMNTRNDDYLTAEITAIGKKLQKDPSGRSLFPEMKQALSHLRESVQSIRDQLVRPSLSHEKLQQLATEYQEVHVRAKRAVDGMQKIGFSMGEYLQRATRQLTWESFIRETTATNTERHGKGLLREEGPRDGPGSGKDYDSWKEFEQWKEFEKWKEFKRWREYEQWMKYRQRRMHRHGTDEQQQVRVGGMATEEQVDTDRVAEARNEQGNREQRKPTNNSLLSVSLSTGKKSERYTVPATIPSVSGIQSTAALVTSSTPASAALTLEATLAGGSTVPSKKTSGMATPSGANESTGQSTVARQQTAPTTGSAATELKTDTSVSGRPNVSTDSLYGSGRTGSAGRPATAPSGGTTVTAAADKPKGETADVPKGGHGKPRVSTSDATSGDGRRAASTATGGSSAAGAAGRGQNPTEGSVRATSSSPPGGGDGSRPTKVSGGQPNAIQSAAYSTNAGSPSSSPPSRAQSGGARRPSISGSGTATASMGTIWETQANAVPQGSGAGRSSVGVTVGQGSFGISAEANRSAQDALARGNNVGTEQGSREQLKSLHSTSDSSSTSSSNQNQNERYTVAAVGRGVVGTPPSTQDRMTNDGGVPMATRTSRRPSGGTSGSPPVIQPSTSFGSGTSWMAHRQPSGSTVAAVSQQESIRQQELARELEEDRERSRPRGWPWGPGRT